MRKERTLIERIVLDKTDLNKLALQRYATLGNDYVILSGRNRRYICHIKNQEYQVLGVYEIDKNKGSEGELFI